MVHPHTRGEDCHAYLVPTAFYGSPPHTWGRRSHHFIDHNKAWFTPTHVGKTHKLANGFRINVVHPHTRGEDVDMGLVFDSVDGSPPHTWGRHHAVLGQDRKEWFTPTHVGKTPPHIFFQFGDRVHPHTRGEDWSRS